jgi:hypothetical protein
MIPGLTPEMVMCIAYLEHWPGRRDRENMRWTDIGAGLIFNGNVHTDARRRRRRRRRRSRKKEEEEEVQRR